MAYTANTLSLIAGPLTGPGKQWVYITADAAATVDTSGYFSDGVDRGMAVHDLVTVIDTATPLTSVHRVSDINTTTKVADLANPTTVGATTDGD